MEHFAERAMSRERKILLLDFELELVWPFVQDDKPILTSQIPDACRQ